MPPPGERSLRSLRRALFAAGALVPLLFYVATAGAFAYWLDGGEFVAAAATLGISHPPGHPLAALVGAIAALLPAGPHALRVSLASAAAAAAAAGLLALCIETTLRALGLTAARLRVPLALGGAWLAAFAPGFWFQAVRPEVYALEAALLFFVLDRLLSVEVSWPAARPGALYPAAFVFGLALANHHLLTLLILPAAAGCLARVLALRGPHPLAWCAAAAGLGLLTYAYLPLRGLAAPHLNLGAPTDLSRFFWVVSAAAFQKNTGDGAPAPLGDRFADVAVVLEEGFGFAVLGLAVLGLYALVRLTRTRRVGLVWLLVLSVGVGARAWLGFVRGNPDAAGYLMPVFGAVAAAFAAALGVLWGVLRRGPPGARADRVEWLAWLLPLAVVGAAATHADRASLARFTDTDALDDVTLRGVPARAVLVAHDPQTVFRAYDWLGAGAERPDVTLIPVPFLPYPGMAEALVAEDDALRPLLRAFLVEGGATRTALETAAARRPLLVELDPRVPVQAMAALRPAGLWFEALPSDAVRDDRLSGARSARAAWARLAARLPRPTDPETRNRILWRRYLEALYYASAGERRFARSSLAAALAVNPDAAELKALADALAEPNGRGPIDITPFLPRRLE